MNRAEAKEIMQRLVAENRLPLIEVHMLRPSGPALLNRDFNGRVKLIKYGGVDRVRVSSASINHPIRVKEYTDNAAHSKLFPQALAKKLEAMGKGADYCNAAMGAVFENAKDKGKKGSDQILAFCDHDVTEIANIITKMIPDVKDFDSKTKWDNCRKALAANTKERAVDDTTCLMGRMSTETHILESIEAARHISHMYSIDAWSGDSDTFTAVDDLKGQIKNLDFMKFLDEKVSDQGSAYLDDNDIAANVFYGYTSISTRTLLENKLRNIEKNDKEGIITAIDESKNIIKNYIMDYLLISPRAKQASNATSPEPLAVLITAGTEVYPMTADSTYEKVIIGNENKSVGEQGVKRLAEFADKLTGGAFAVNKYQKMFWISAEYGDSKPKACESTNLDTAIYEILSIVGE